MTFAKNMPPAELIRPGFVEFLSSQGHEPFEIVSRNRPVRTPTVIDILADSAILDQAGTLELCKMGRNPRLPHPEDFLNLSNGKLLPFQEKKQSSPNWIGENFK